MRRTERKVREIQKELENTEKYRKNIKKKALLAYRPPKALLLLLCMEI